MMKCMLFAGMYMLLIFQFISEYEEDWPQLGHDAHHTFFSDSFVPDHLGIVWQYQLESPGEYFQELLCYFTSPAVVGDRVYILDFDCLYCLSLQTGRLLHVVPAFSVHPHTPVVADGRVYLAADRDTFQCLDANTGEPVWKRELPNLHIVSPIVDNDAVYVTVDHFSLSRCDLSPCCPMTPQWSTLLAMDKETGEEIWHYSAVDDGLAVMKGVGFPILADETIIFYINYYKDEETWDADPKKSSLICLDACTGVVKWKREGILPISPTGLPGFDPLWMAYYSNNLYIGMLGYVVCVDVETQEPLWEYNDISGWALLSVGNGVVVVRSWLQVDCLDAETGKKLWELPVTGISMPAMTENEVFIGSDDKTLYRADIKSGNIIESYYLGDSVYSPVVARGHVLVGTYKNQIYCLRPSELHMLVICTAVLAAVFLSMVVLQKTRARLHT